MTAANVIAALHLAVAAVCPIEGVSLGAQDDKETWRIDFSSGASDEQKAAAQAVVTAFDPVTVVVPNNITKPAFLALFTSAELLAISAATRTSDTINIWMITAQAHDMIDLSDPLTKQGLDALVTAGLITSDRETAILANQPPS